MSEIFTCRYCGRTHATDLICEEMFKSHERQVDSMKAERDAWADDALLRARNLTTKSEALEAAEAKVLSITRDYVGMCDVVRDLEAQLCAAQAEIEQAYISFAFAGIRSTSIAEGIEALRDELAAITQKLEGANSLLREWGETELDSMDEEYEPWLESFTARVNAVLAAALSSTEAISASVQPDEAQRSARRSHDRDDHLPGHQRAHQALCHRHSPDGIRDEREALEVAEAKVLSITRDYIGMCDVVRDLEAQLCAAQAGQIREALVQSMVAFDDWLHITAPTECGRRRVAESIKRIGEVGTISYIASVQKINREALAKLDEIAALTQKLEATDDDRCFGGLCQHGFDANGAEHMVLCEKHAKIEALPEIRNTRRVYRNGEEYMSYLRARFPSNGAASGLSFEWNGLRWKYEHTDFDERGDFDLLLGAAPTVQPDEAQRKGKA